MRITFLLPGRGWKPVGGVKIVYEYANCLARRGHEVTVIHPALLDRDTPWGQFPKKLVRYMQANVDHSYLPQKWFVMDPRVHMKWVWSLHPRSIPNGDAVIATAWQTAEWVQTYGYSKGKKYYLIQHWEDWDGVAIERLRRTWTAELHKIVIARWLKDIALELGQTAEYIPNGLDFSAFGVDVAITRRSTENIFMLYHEQPWKGTKDGLEALRIVKERHPNLQAVLFGTPAHPQDLPDWAQYIRLPSPAHLRKLYNQSAIFLSPSWTEGWSLPPAEAMQCGLLLVTNQTKNYLLKIYSASPLRWKKSML